METNKAFCSKCNNKVDYTAKKQLDSFEIRGQTFYYFETSAYCAECGEEVYVPAINDLNCTVRENIYFEYRDENKENKNG